MVLPKFYSFEPNLQNTIRFCESLSLNHYFVSNRERKQEEDIVVPISKGLGNVEESKKFYSFQKGNPGSFTFKSKGKNTKLLDILNITTLDAFAERHGWFDSKPNIGFFKLDVENFELEVLEGAEKLLKSHLIEKIALELKPEQNEERKLNILKHLFNAGYEIHMHGRFRGPAEIVEKTFNSPEELAEDLKNYGENVLFRLRKTI